MTYRILNYFIAALVVTAAIGCGRDQKPATPLETFKTYVKALKQKDTTTMKLLLSSESVKMLEQEAKAMGTTLDDVVKRETLFSESQTTVEFRNERIDGERATIEVKNSFGSWETVPFVLEDGEWKIDKKGYADRLMRDIEESQRKIDELIDEGRKGPEGPASPTPSVDQAESP